MGTGVSKHKVPIEAFWGALGKKSKNAQKTLENKTGVLLVEVHQLIDCPVIRHVVLGRVILYVVDDIVKAVTFEQNAENVMMFK